MKNPDDPYLFWVIPAFRWPKGMKVNPLGGPNMPLSPSGEYDVYDYLEKHARLGSNRKGR